MVLAILPPGEFFGEMAIVNNRPRTATATVVDDSVLLVRALDGGAGHIYFGAVDAVTPTPSLRSPPQKPLFLPFT